MKSRNRRSHHSQCFDGSSDFIDVTYKRSTTVKTMRRIIGTFKKKFEKKESSGSFSNFFTHASDREKKRVFTEAARRANEDQRALFDRAKLKLNEQ